MVIFYYILLYSVIFCYILLYSVIFCYILLHSVIICYIMLEGKPKLCKFCKTVVSSEQMLVVASSKVHKNMPLIQGSTMIIKSFVLTWSIPELLQLFLIFRSSTVQNIERSTLPHSLAMMREWKMRHCQFKGGWQEIK